MEFAEVYSSYSSFSRSLSYPRIFTTFGKTDIDTSSFSKALKVLNLEVHLLKPVLPTSSVTGVNIKYGQEKQEGIHMRNMTPQHQENCAATFHLSLRREGLDVHVVP